MSQRSFSADRSNAALVHDGEAIPGHAAPSPSSEDASGILETGAGSGRVPGVPEIVAQLSAELGVALPFIESVIRLLDEGNTIPFLARYRKEQTGGLDEEVLRSIHERVDYMRSLAARKDEVIHLLEEQGSITPEIRQALAAADSLQRVEDIYRPFRPKRRTRASIAREQGLEPLATWLLSRPSLGDPLQQAAMFVNLDKGIESGEQALAGARDIVAETLSDDPDVRTWVRRWTSRNGMVATEAVDSALHTPYEQYYDYREAAGRIPPHRVLAINRGEREKALRVRIEVDEEPVLGYLRSWTTRSGPQSSPADSELVLAARDLYKRLLAPAVERDVRNQLTEVADAQAIRVFAANLRALLLTPPIRGKVVMGVDPAYRTGCKIAVVDHTGKLLEIAVVYPTPPHNRVGEAEHTLLQMIERCHVDVIAIGNGTASRETEAFVSGMIPKAGRPVAYVMVNEAGASVYSASATAREEFPDLDVSERSAASIARRLQDALAELVKIEPKAIGVGQYQHDVAEKELAKALQAVVESAVNSVGVNVNTASAALLSYVAGLSPAVAGNIVKKRDADGAYASRKALLTVPRLGPKTYEQCAGFLRIPEGMNPLDNTAIHPESYPVAEKLLAELGFSVDDVAGTRRSELTDALGRLAPQEWAGQLSVGQPTLEDIVEALLRPSLDPRDDLPPPVLRTDVLTMDDLHTGIVLQGTVRNVVDFGAFVDIGVHQDGLVHISELSERYVRRPLDAVSVGDVVWVRVLSIDKERNRIALSMRDAARP
ncbi:MAG: Tex family protein [Clostridia bacterium]|nr:Tex family protein [Clostridia bacterium]